VKRDSLIRPIMRRADSGVDTISVNGGPPVSGPIVINSPMATLISPNTVRLDNSNTKSIGTAPVTNDIDTEVNNGFFVFAQGNLTIPIPKAPTAPNSKSEGRKITFTIKIDTGVLPITITWAGGATGYQWANPGRAGAVGPFVTDFNALVAGAAQNDFIKIGFEFTTFGAPAGGNWFAVALAGSYR
jgi:hypothetical protein